MFRLAINCLSMAAVLLMVAVPGLAQQGDPQRGEALYVGTAGFSLGGAPCLACHGITGHALGHAGGASYGPDLTDFHENYGEEGVAAVLEDLSFESMEAIYADRPLTEMERADLVAFFGTVTVTEGAGADAGLAWHTLLGTVLIMALIGALGWRRLQGVRQPLVEQAATGKGEVA